MNLLKMNEKYSGKEVAKYRLLIPDDLEEFYNGKGFSYQDLEWISDEEKFLKAAEENCVPLEEKEDQKSSVYWMQQLERLKKRKVAVEEALGKRLKLVAESKEELEEIRCSISHHEEMKLVAKSKEDLFSMEGGPKEKLALMTNVQLLWTAVSDKEMSQDEVVKTILDLRAEVLKLEKPGPSRSTEGDANQKGKRKRQSSESEEGILKRDIHFMVEFLLAYLFNLKFQFLHNDVYNSRRY